MIDKEKKWIFTTCRLLNIKTILDVGCGNGKRIDLPLFEKGFKVHGIDIDEGSIKSAKKNQKKGLSFDCMSIFDTKEHYDVILCLHVVEHISKKDTAEFLNKIKCLADYYLFAIPHGYGVNEFIGRLGKWKSIFLKKIGINKFRHPRPEWTCNYEGNLHKQYFTLKGFTKILRSKGFKIVKCELDYKLGLPKSIRVLCKNK